MMARLGYIPPRVASYSSLSMMLTIRYTFSVLAMCLSQVVFVVMVQGVTALATLQDSKTIISGGGEGQVRIWEANSKAYTMMKALKEHRGAVTCIRVRKNDQECVTSSSDGTCIIWDLE